MRMVVLASSSPRRKDILEELSVSFDIIPSQVDEAPLCVKYGNKPSRLVKKLSCAKALDVLKTLVESGCENACGEPHDECGKNDRNLHNKGLKKTKSSGKHGVLQQNGVVIIGADTVVALGRRIFGKPKNRLDAVDMIATLNNKWHKVFTGVTLVYDGKAHTFCVCSRVKFKNLSKQDIENYVDTCNPLDKAGAYGIQDDYVVQKYTGSYTNIVGLPKEKLTVALKRAEVI